MILGVARFVIWDPSSKWLNEILEMRNTERTETNKLPLGVSVCTGKEKEGKRGRVLIKEAGTCTEGLDLQFKQSPRKKGYLGSRTSLKR